MCRANLESLSHFLSEQIEVCSKPLAKNIDVAAHLSAKILKFKKCFFPQVERHFGCIGLGMLDDYCGIGGKSVGS